MFIDYAEIRVKAGDGGDGCVSFRREKFVPRGGPDGGSGGSGGDVIIKADRGLTTLLDFRYKPYLKAENGKHGKGKTKAGRSGAGLVVKVPPGTVIRDVSSGRMLADLVEDGEMYLAARGGSGGRGNSTMKSPTNRAPRRFEQGKPGAEANLALELKLIADVGLVGSPNAGKSTLISRFSNAAPKIAEYPFTTVQPQVGVVKTSGFFSFTMAEIPGLIKDAHKGKGLGDRFLRHVERTKLLLHLVDLADDPVRDFRIVREELSFHSDTIKPRMYIVVGNKVDLPGARDNLQALSREVKKHSTVHNEAIGISALTGEGTDGLKEFLGGMVERKKNEN